MPKPYNIDHDNCFVKCLGYLNLSVQKKEYIYWFLELKRKKKGGKLVYMS